MDQYGVHKSNIRVKLDDGTYQILHEIEMELQIHKVSAKCYPRNGIIIGSDGASNGEVEEAAASRSGST